MKKKFIISACLFALFASSGASQVVTSRFKPFSYQEMENAVSAHSYTDYRRVPENNLGRSVEGMRSDFPTMAYDGKNAYGDDIYRAVTDSQVEYLFNFRYNRLVSEGMTIKGSRRVVRDWFYSTLKALKNTSFTRCGYDDDLYVFYYQDFEVTLFLEESSTESTGHISYRKR